MKNPIRKRPGTRRRELGGLAIAVLATLAPAPVLAQTWLAPKGEGSFAFGYANIWIHDHYFNDGVPTARGSIYSHSVASNLGYAVTDRFTLSVGIPFVASKYEGGLPHVPVGRPPLDTGSYHSTFQDFRFEARFMATTGSFVATPFLAVTLPSHGYESWAHSAVGKDLKEIQAGASFGRRLDPLLPNAYFQARYGFAVPERPLGVWHNRSNLDFDVGYFVTPALTLRTLGFWQITHGGFREQIDSRATPLNYAHHDQLDRSIFFDLGFGASYALTRSLDGFASWYKTLSGRNGHKIAGAVTVGVSVNFSPAQMLRRKKAPATPKLTEG
jgi:hypothetical protein